MTKIKVKVLPWKEAILHKSKVYRDEIREKGVELPEREVIGEIRNYSDDGYVKEEHPMPGITILEMNGKGFASEFLDDKFDL